jgi:hypothetical protein
MKKFFEKFKMRDKGTILRTILLVLSIANYILALIGKTCWGTGPVYEWISFGVFLVMTLISYWYNNNWTGFASLAEDIFNMLSDGKITSEELAAFIAKHKSDISVATDTNASDSSTAKTEESGEKKE